MKIIKPSATIEYYTPNALEQIERAGRTCYKSEDKITPGSAEKFCRMLREREHLAMFDHAYAAVRFIVDRGISHEVVRHRIGVGYAQESTRYVSYAKGKFGGECTFIKPSFWSEDDENYIHWYDAMYAAECSYLYLIKCGASPQEARSVLPNSTKTELMVTGTFTYWKHFFKLRSAKEAHPQMREVVIPLLRQFIELWPAAFEDLEIKE